MFAPPTSEPIAQPCRDGGLRRLASESIAPTKLPADCFWGHRSSRAPARKSQPPHQEQHDENDYDDADDADASMTVAIAIPSKTATEPAEQEYDEYDDEYESDGHYVSP